MSGYISIHRKLRDHWLYKENRVFSKFEAWVDILYEVNHKDNKFLFDGVLIEVKRGSTITSLRKLSDNWKWSVTKVNNFLKMLENDEMLVVKKDTKKTLLTVIKYDFYQSEKWKKEQQSNTEKTVEEHSNNTEVTQKETNNNELIMSNNELIMNNNVKKDNIPFAEIINHLNEKTKKSYKHNTDKTKSLITARFNEGYKLEDFKKVIDIKCSAWLKDEKMNIYLRPETLFSNKFEGYLNEKFKDADEEEHKKRVEAWKQRTGGL